MKLNKKEKTEIENHYWWRDADSGMAYLVGVYITTLMIHGIYIQMVYGNIISLVVVYVAFGCFMSSAILTLLVWGIVELLAWVFKPFRIKYLEMKQVGKL